MNKALEDLVDLMFDTDMEEVMKEKSTLEYIHKLQQENKQLNSILTELEEYIVKITKNGANIEKLTCSNILVYLKELKERYKC